MTSIVWLSLPFLSVLVRSVLSVGLIGLKRKPCLIPAGTPYSADYANGSLLASGNYVPHDALVRYVCPEGEHLAAGSCDWNTCKYGSWFYTKAVCEPYERSCKRPRIPNADLSGLRDIRLPSGDRKFPNGTTVEIICAPNAFRNFSDGYTVCENGKWNRYAEFHSMCLRPLPGRRRKGKGWKTMPESQLAFVNTVNEAGVQTILCTMPYVSDGYYTNETVSIGISEQPDFVFENGFRMSVFCASTKTRPVQGSAELLCDYGSWLAQKGWPNCRTSCRMPYIRNGRSEVPLGVQVQHQQHIVYECLPGFKTLAGLERVNMTCVNGHWALEYRKRVGEASESNVQRSLHQFLCEEMSALTNQDWMPDVSGTASQLFASCYTPILTGIGNRNDGGKVMQHGKTYHVRCGNSFVNVGSTQLTCLHGELRFEGQWPQCQPRCGMRSFPNAYLLESGSGIKFGKVIIRKVKCWEGFYLTGHPNVICVDGNWYPCTVDFQEGSGTPNLNYLLEKVKCVPDNFALETHTYDGAN